MVKKSENKMIWFSFRLSPELKADLKSHSNRNGFYMGQFLRNLLEKELGK